MQAATIVILLFKISVLCSGIFFNMLVTSCSFRTWQRNGFRSSQDLIVLFMGLSCTAFSSFQFSVDMSFYIWNPIFQNLNLCFIGILVIFPFLFFLSFSMTAWLCVFYCMKIVSFHHRVLVALKFRFLVRLPHLIAGTFVVASILLILLVCAIFTSFSLESNDNSTFLCRKLNDTLMDNVLFITNMFNLSIVGPFLLIVLSLGSTVTSLVRHIRRIQLSASLDNSHVKAHVKAILIMTLLLMLNVLFFISNQMLCWRLVAGNDFLEWIFLVLYYIYCPLQALVLLFRIHKSSSVAFLSFFRCLSKEEDNCSE